MDINRYEILMAIPVLVAVYLPEMEGIQFRLQGSLIILVYLLSRVR